LTGEIISNDIGDKEEDEKIKGFGLKFLEYFVILPLRSHFQSVGSILILCN
jgi:hypothetical protein